MKRFDAINVVPFIDVMLVLLAIVLMTATFIVHGRLQIDLPRSEVASVRAERPGVEVAIDRDGRLYLDSRPLEIDALEARLTALPPATALTLRVDAGVPFARFVAVAEILQRLGRRDVAVLTETRR